MFLCLLESIGAKQLGSIAYIAGPSRYRKVEENKKNNSGKIVGCNSATPESYDQTT